MFQDIKDEVLSGEPRYTIKNSSGNVLSDNVDISLKTPITQEGTPVNRALFRNLQGDLYTQDRYNELEMHRRMVSVDYETNLVYSEENHIGDCIPKVWTATDSTNLVYVAEDGTKVYASSKDGSHTPDKACDGDEETFWHANTYGKNQHLTIEFVNPIRIKKIKVAARLYSPSWSVDFYIWGSNDNQNWTTLATTSTPLVTNPSLKEINIESVVAYKYFRFATEVYGKQTCVIHELQVTEYSTDVVYGKYEYYSNLDIPITSYEEGKIVNIECGRIVDETTKGNIVPKSGWEINGDMYSENIDGTSISSSMSGGNNYNVWYVCDGADASYFRPVSSTSIISLTYKFPYKVKISKMKLKQNGLGSSTSINISAGNNITNLTTLFTGTGEYSNTQEVSLNGSLGYYQYYRLTISADSSSVPMIYVWEPSEVQGIIYDEFVDIYMNINNNGERCIKGKIKYGQRYNLVYTNGVWEIIDGIVTGRYASQYNDATTVNIELGFKPKYVILFGSSNMVSSVGVSVSGTVSPSYIPRIISEFSTSDTLNDDGFTVALSTTGNGNVYHSFYYIAIR